MTKSREDKRPQSRRQLEPERLARLEKQEKATPSWLAVRDKKLIRLLAIAGMGGSY
ncbi:hypothetical protein [Thiohalomonas denitrificans]|uniref:Uncharacterized protein n=1 Tax=Thiohalomonas denitrificans TaxID=415747 RepID=A0A1G5QI48_9GAMM|nr:hypothetical protein [Thiohalomonas denitrificans]SCZ61210.1 hypothetical protein SAMN03097708_02101 [Thiohalomonas denitrificans]